MDVFEAIHGRRSIRRFTDKRVPKEDLIKMLDAARMAPSGGNLQAWRFMVIEDRSIIAGMASIIENKIADLNRTVNMQLDESVLLSNLRARFKDSSLFFQNAPLTIAVQVGENLYMKPVIRYLEKKGMDSYEAHRKAGFVEIQSVSAAIQNLLLAAHSLGYGACWTNVPFIAVRELEKLLEVEDPWHLIALVPLGVPDPVFIPNSLQRKELDELVVFRS